MPVMRMMVYKKRAIWQTGDVVNQSTVATSLEEAEHRDALVRRLMGHVDGVTAALASVRKYSFVKIEMKKMIAYDIYGWNRIIRTISS